MITEQPKRRRRSFKLWEWLVVLEANGGKCVYCERASETMDHVIPFARGGADALSNLAPACESCNASKNDKTPPAWWIATYLPFGYHFGHNATPQGSAGSRSLRDRYLTLHEEVLYLLDQLDVIASEIANPTRTAWFRKAFASTHFNAYPPPTAREMAAACRRLYADELSMAREAGWPELKASPFRLIRRK
ncbi:HNH endonuclease [Streptomyces sp. NPDC053493]|uniref:HNH endonuclease n=1 Tax=Streptomyces sp. NPDC053493 TaxID=3365705 RepID=UPI0037D417CB